MFCYKVALNGPGGELDSRVFWVSADDQEGLRMKICRWLEDDRTILDGGDSIVITNVRDQ